MLGHKRTIAWVVCGLFALAALIGVYWTMRAECKYACLSNDHVIIQGAKDDAKKQSNNKQTKKSNKKSASRKQSNQNQVVQQPAAVTCQAGRRCPANTTISMPACVGIACGPDGACHCKNDYVRFLDGNWVFSTGNQKLDKASDNDLMVGEGSAENLKCPDCGHLVIDHDDDCAKWNAKRKILPSGERFDTNSIMTQ